MRITNANNSNWGSITKIDNETKFYPSICIEIVIESVLKITMRKTEIFWIENWKVEEFIKELKAIEASRKGVAKLATEPEEFECVIGSLNEIGQMYIELKLNKRKYLDEYYKLEIGFEIDAGLLNTIIYDFTALLNDDY